MHWVDDALVSTRVHSSQVAQGLGWLTVIAIEANNGISQAY